MPRRKQVCPKRMKCDAEGKETKDGEQMQTEEQDDEGSNGEEEQTEEDVGEDEEEDELPHKTPGGSQTESPLPEALPYPEIPAKAPTDSQELTNTAGETPKENSVPKKEEVQNPVTKTPQESTLVSSLVTSPCTDGKVSPLPSRCEWSSLQSVQNCVDKLVSSFGRNSSYTGGSFSVAGTSSRSETALKANYKTAAYDMKDKGYCSGSSVNAGMSAKKNRNFLVALKQSVAFGSAGKANKPPTTNHVLKDEPLDLSVKQSGGDLDGGALDLTKRKEVASDNPMSYLQQLERKFGTCAKEDELKPNKPHTMLNTLPSFSTNVFTAALYNMKPVATTDLVYRNQAFKQMEQAAKSPRSVHENSSPNSFIDRSMKVLQKRIETSYKTYPPRLTAFMCECKKEYDTLYKLTMHIQETGHMPKRHRTTTGEYPKLVRGQDMWLTQGSEQTKQILRCMQCGESFRTLPELTVHMMQTKHYAKIINSESQRSHRSSPQDLSDDMMLEPPLSPHSPEMEVPKSPRDLQHVAKSPQQDMYLHEKYPLHSPFKKESDSFNHTISVAPKMEDNGDMHGEDTSDTQEEDPVVRPKQEVSNHETSLRSSVETKLASSSLHHSFLTPTKSNETFLNGGEPSVSDYLGTNEKEKGTSSTTGSALAAMEKFVNQRFDAKPIKEHKLSANSPGVKSLALSPSYMFPMPKSSNFLGLQSAVSPKLRDRSPLWHDGHPNGSSIDESQFLKSTCGTSDPLNLCLPKKPLHCSSPVKQFDKFVPVVTEHYVNGKSPQRESPNSDTKPTNGGSSTNGMDKLNDKHSISDGQKEPLESKYLSVKEEPVTSKSSDSALESLKGMVYGHSFSTEHPLDSLQKLIHDSVQQRSVTSMPDSHLVSQSSVAYSQAGPSTFILVNPIVTVVSPPGLPMHHGENSPGEIPKKPRTLLPNQIQAKPEEEFETKDKGEIVCKNCGKTYSATSYRYHTTWCSIASTQAQHKLELKEALHFSPYIYMPLDHNTSCYSPYRASKSTPSPESSENCKTSTKQIKTEPDSSSSADKFHKYYQMADELTRKK